MNQSGHTIAYDSGVDILNYRGHVPLLEALELTEEQVPEVLSQVDEDPYHAAGHMYFEFTVGSIALMANAILFLIMRRHRKQLPSLVFILQLAMSVDIFLSMATMACQPVINVTYGYFACYCGNAFLPNNIGLRSVLMVMQGTGIMSTVIWLPIQFAYRYHYVVQGQPPSVKRQSVYFFFSLSGFFAVMYIMSEMHKPNPTFRELARLLFYVDGWGTRADQDFMGGGIGELRVWMFGGYNAMTTTVAYGFVIMLELKIMKALNEMQKGRLLKEAIDINRALTALALVPLLTAVFPIMLYMMTMFACIDPGQVMINATFTLSLPPVLNPITTIALIKPYRRTFLRWSRLKHVIPIKVSTVSSDYTTTKNTPNTKTSKQRGNKEVF
ncbi:unnamed protein product [Bursaphelenchus xylophilus]|uniref:(pine wood nematode) hypothetical protein n=1 Tax=Bursaphelenchus xylophilus TaxID=6326 RepID=A0A1I7RIY7_BURXY|nr:unnamed protein product [Bursaphelenchus xylophilus]CAG9119180.1 unnamed protein product [Bursaphelenchus xylophilus]